ncbi:hypothetical protein AB0B48_08905 [Micromonospora sp. NPDC049089]|uniref:hypothetical protein n=1 Tax=Micromonospora sp. NPDC049089 TaxID=3155496 RepID=UPI0033CF3BB0
MTRAPANLLAVRNLLLTHLDNAPGPDDLDPGEVGIVGDTAHRGGYHCGSDRVVTNDYSVVESPRDRAGLTDYAAGLDVGPFQVRDPLGRIHNLQTFSVWCVAQCAANAPDTRDIREIIYSPNGTTVKRWDRLGKRTSGDSSHRWHTHFSFFRDAIKAGRDQRPLFRRYLQSIGLIEGDDMSATAEKQIAELHAALLDPKRGGYGVNLTQMLKDSSWSVVQGNTAATWLGQTLLAVAKASGVTKAQLDEIRARVDEAAEADRRRDADMAGRLDGIADLLSRMESGELTAEQVLAKLRELLPAQG